MLMQAFNYWHEEFGGVFEGFENFLYVTLALVFRS
jgi:hypothetical protein